MCTECGCGLPGEKPATISGPDHGHDHHHHDGHDHDHDHTHGHPHDHPHPHPHEHDPHQDSAEQVRTLSVHRAILEKNNRLAERNRGYFRARGLLVVNMLSAPGSGKTTLVRETIRRLAVRGLRTGVIVGDLATDNDARRLRESGAPVVQVNTGTVCHLEAEMVSRAAAQVDLNGLGLLVIENVGNLVCPASYDLGEDLRVVLLSVTEGEDKPLKYPPMFQSAGAIVVSKIDLIEPCGYDREAAQANLRHLAPGAPVFETSAKTGQGMDAWCDFLLQQHQAIQSRNPLLG